MDAYMQYNDKMNIFKTKLAIVKYVEPRNMQFQTKQSDI